MTTLARCTWPIVLTLVTGRSVAFAQSPACYPVQRGDTASQLARRITGDASNKYQLWFDLRNLSNRSVPKSQYDRIRSGWRACVVEKTVVQGRRLEVGPVKLETAKAASRVEPAASTPPADVPQTIQDVFRPNLVALRTSLNVDSTDMWLGAAVVVPPLGLLLVGGYVRRRNTARIFMSQFAYLFVREFERPLLRHAAEPAVKARLRVSLYPARLEICLAPGNGHRYPNLSDHRKNVEYDVKRVLSAIADESFVCGRLHMRDGWVVVPFRFIARLKHRGVRCISSL